MRGAGPTLLATVEVGFMSCLLVFFPVHRVTVRHYKQRVWFPACLWSFGTKSHNSGVMCKGCVAAQQLYR